MARYYQLALIAICLFCLSSCASPYLGRQVNINTKSVCTFKSFPASCTWKSNDFHLRYQIEKTEKIGEYIIHGTAEYIGSQTWTNFKNATFTLLLVRNKIIAEEVNIAGAAGSLDKTITFSRTFFTTNEFEASLLTYGMDVRG